MDVRITRLQADHKRLKDMFAVSPTIRIVETVGYPPERYILEYKVKGLARDPKSGQVVTRDTFQVELTLTDAYPRHPPQCRAVTDAFHPNIVTDAICVTDYWSAGASICRLVVRIAELLSYQSYGLKYPLNPDAANWVEAHRDELPTDRSDFVSILHASEGVRRSSEEDIRPMDQCVQCGAYHQQSPLHVTDSNHLVCEDCLFRCAHCGVIMSVKSPQEKCEICDATVCYKCIHRCLNCGILVCFDHMTKCDVCELGHCPNCIRACDGCGARVCVEHSAPAQREGEQVLLCENCLLKEQ